MFDQSYICRASHVYRREDKSCVSAKRLMMWFLIERLIIPLTYKNSPVLHHLLHTDLMEPKRLGTRPLLMTPHSLPLFSSLRDRSFCLCLYCQTLFMVILFMPSFLYDLSRFVYFFSRQGNLHAGKMLLYDHFAIKSN